MVFTENGTNSALKGCTMTSKPRKKRVFFSFGQKKFHGCTSEVSLRVSQKTTYTTPKPCTVARIGAKRSTSNLAPQKGASLIGSTGKAHLDLGLFGPF